MDAAAAQQRAPGLSAEDARRVGAMEHQGVVSEAALKFDHCDG